MLRRILLIGILTLFILSSCAAKQEGNGNNVDSEVIKGQFFYSSECSVCRELDFFISVQDVNGTLELTKTDTNSDNGRNSYYARLKERNISEKGWGLIPYVVLEEPKRQCLGLADCKRLLTDVILNGAQNGLDNATMTQSLDQERIRIQNRTEALQYVAAMNVEKVRLMTRIMDSFSPMARLRTFQNLQLMEHYAQECEEDGCPIELWV